MCSAETTRRLDEWDAEHPNPTAVGLIDLYICISDKLLISPSKFPFICLWNQRRIWHYIKRHFGLYSMCPFIWKNWATNFLLDTVWYKAFCGWPKLRGAGITEHRTMLPGDQAFWPLVKAGSSGTPLCSSRKNPYPPHGRSSEIPRGRGS